MINNHKMQPKSHLYRVGSIFSENELRDLKEEISLQVGAKLSKTSNNNQVRFLCYQNGTKCQFVYRFLRRNGLGGGQVSNGEYELMEVKNAHQQHCYWSNQERRLSQRKIQLVSYKAIISQIIRQMDKQAYPSNILKILAARVNLKHDFLYEGFQDNSEYRRQIKKKFDNIVAEIKKDIHPTHNKHEPIYIVEQGSRPHTAILRRLTWADKEDQIYTSNLQKSKRRFMGHSKHTMDHSTINEYDSQDLQWSPNTFSARNIKSETIMEE